MSKLCFFYMGVLQFLYVVILMMKVTILQVKNWFFCV